MTAPADWPDTEHRVRTALVRDVPASYVRCLKRPGLLDPLDVTVARRQHLQYVEALDDCGVSVTVVPSEDGVPDAPFIEDTAVILPGRHAVLTRSAVSSRAAEAEGVRSFLVRHCAVEVMPAGATLDGGDVLWVGGDLYVGISERTNNSGLAFLERVARLAELTVRPVPIQGALHLKSCCTYLGRGLVLHAKGKVRSETFRDMRLVCAPEADGANVLPVNGKIIVPAEAPRTRELLDGQGFETLSVPLGEFLKGNGGPTCLSLRIS